MGAKNESESTTKKVVVTAAKLAWIVPAVIASIGTSRADEMHAPRPT